LALGLGKNMFEIEIDKNIRLLPFETRHSDELFQLVDENRAYLRPWLAWVDDTKSSADVKAHIERTIEQLREGSGAQIGIFVNGTIVGTTGIISINKVNLVGEIGYWIAENSQGKGLITRSTEKIIEFGFKELKLNRIEIRVILENKPSQLIAERLGFTKEGILRQAFNLNEHFHDHVVYSKLKSEHSNA
jgi:ribosomal-protein-serine acetyltransferase